MTQAIIIIKTKINIPLTCSIVIKCALTINKMRKPLRKYNRLCTYHSMLPTNALTFTIKILSI